MFVRSKTSSAALIALGAIGTIAAWPAFGQEVQRVEITGSNIRRTAAETSSPLQVISAEQLKASGYTSAQDVLQELTANGQGTLSQNFSGAFATGAGGVALRGLTVGATLVLIDGRRMAPYPIGDDGQRSFVDISKIPFDAIERIEVLKDGASAVYGSDAIAGVVNIILKRQFKGAQIAGDIGATRHNDGQTSHLAGTWGIGDLAQDGRNFYVSVEARKQRPIFYAQRPGLLTQTDFTSTGGYDTTFGRVFPLAPNPASATGFVRDAAGNRYFMPGCDAAAFSAGQCTFTDTWSQVQVPTENLNLVTRYTQNFADSWQLSLQGSLFRGKAETNAPPGVSRSTGFQGITSGPGVVPQLRPVVPRTTLPSTNPSFPASAAAAGLTEGFLTYTFLDFGPRRVLTDSTATRLIADLQGTLGSWDLNAAVGLTEVKLDLTGKNFVNPANLQAALNRTTDPYKVGQPNSDAVKAFMAPELSVTDTSKLSFVHLGAGTDLARLAGGALALGLGVDYYERKQDGRAPADVAAGLIGGFSNNFTIGTQKVGSAHAELVAPVARTLQLEAAARYDRYNISGGKASPKLGFKFTPMKEWALRGTWSRGFRAPGPAENGTSGQTFFAGTTNDPVLCPDGDPATPGNFPTQCSIAVGSVQSTNPTLKPETSTSVTLGTIFEPTPTLSFSLDFYRIQLKDQIVTGGDSVVVRGTNLTPIPQVQPDGSTHDVAPPVAPIAYQTSGYINANATTTSGLDLGARWRRRFAEFGEYKTEFMWSYILKYDLTIGDTTFKLAGTHGPFVVSGNTGNPRTRIQWSHGFSRDDWALTGTINHIGSFKITDPSFGYDDCLSALDGGAAATAYGNVIHGDNPRVPDGVSCKVAAFTTFNLHGRYKVSKALELHGSITNLFDRSFPADWNTYGGGTAPYNPSLHGAGAIGRFFSVGASYTF